MKAKIISKTITLIFIMFAGLNLMAAPSSAVPQKSFIYRVKITDVNDRITFDNVSNRLKAIFDSNVRFNDYTDEIIIRSDFDVTQEKLGQDLGEMGYTLKSYRQASMIIHHN